MPEEPRPPAPEPTPRPPQRSGDSPWVQAGMALTIPTLLVCGPVVGYLIGWGLRELFGWPKPVDLIFIVLGAVASVREMMKILRRMNTK